MTEYATQAIEKLKKELPDEPDGRAAAAVHPYIYEQLIKFIKQDDEFAQAIAQSGKTLKECSVSVTHGVGACCSDFEIYRKAVAFYFVGAKIKCEMSVDLVGDNAGDSAELNASGKPKVIKLDLLDFMG